MVMMSDRRLVGGERIQEITRSHRLPLLGVSTFTAIVSIFLSFLVIDCCCVLVNAL